MKTLLGLAIVMGILAVFVFYARSSHVGSRESAVISRVSEPRVEAPLSLPFPLPPQPILPTASPPVKKDDHAAWVEHSNLVPTGPDAPAWVQDAAGSTARAQEAFGRLLQGRYPARHSNLLVGYSRQLEPTRERARSAAESSALEQLCVLALWQSQAGKKRPQESIPLEVLQPMLQKHLQNRLPGYIKSHYEQEIELHQEAVYRCAVLVEARPEELERNLQSVLGDYSRDRFAARRHYLRLAAVIAGASMAVFIGYSLLNAATRGHFAGTLRVLSVLVLGVILFFLTIA